MADKITKNNIRHEQKLVLDSVNKTYNPVVAQDAAWQVSGFTSMISNSFTRPADTVPYSALDTVSNSTSSPTLLTFSNIARIPAGSGYIVKARLMTDQPTNTARFRMHLYHTAPSAINDNLPFTELWANRSNRIGYIDFDACSTEGIGSNAAGTLNASSRIAFVCAAASQTIYGILESKDTFTPASAQNFFVELTVENN